MRSASLLLLFALPLYAQVEPEIDPKHGGDRRLVPARGYDGRDEKAYESLRALATSDEDLRDRKLVHYARIFLESYPHSDMFGVNSANLSRTAIAMSQGGTGAGLIALDADDDCALTIQGSVFVDIDEGAMQVNSTSNQAMCVLGSVADTNADPDLITVPIPGNDDAIRSVSLITKALVDVIAEARTQVPLRETADDSEAYTYSTEGAGEGDEDRPRRKRSRRKRRPKPEAIAARLKDEGEGAAGGSVAAPATADGSDEGSGPTESGGAATTIETSAEAAANAGDGQA